MRRLHHGHSFAAGAVMAYLVIQNGWLILVGMLLVFAAGIVAGRTWLLWQRIAYTVGRKLRAQAINTERRVRSRSSQLGADEPWPTDLY